MHAETQAYLNVFIVFLARQSSWFSSEDLFWAPSAAIGSVGEKNDNFKKLDAAVI